MKIIILIGIMLLSIIASGQPALLIKDGKLSFDDIRWGCVCYDTIVNKDFNTIPLYKRLFLSKDIENKFTILDSQTLDDISHLLDMSIFDTNTVCLLPILQLLDTSAVELYNANCRIVPHQMNNYFFCEEPQLRYFTLFFIEFLIVRQHEGINLKKVESIKLVKKGAKENNSLSDQDYRYLYSRYGKYFRLDDLDKQQRYNVLKKTKYRWVVNLK
jgi:hypothetical protein